MELMLFSFSFYLCATTFVERKGYADDLLLFDRNIFSPSASLFFVYSRFCSLDVFVFFFAVFTDLCPPMMWGALGG